MSERLALIAVTMTGMIMLVGMSIALLLQQGRRGALEARVTQAVSGHAASGPSLSGMVQALRSLGERVRRLGLYKDDEIENLEALILTAGYNARRALPVILGIKMALMVVLPVLALVLAEAFLTSIQAQFAVFATALVIGMRGPNWLLALLRRSYVAALDRGTPDALDLLVVCSEAGMGLESALERVSREMRLSNPQVATLLASLLDDLRVLPDRREAFQKFGRRSGVEGFQRLATMLAQALQFGTPLGQALRSVAIELRRVRTSRLEERAVKLATKLTIPMIMFMMPTVWIILIGGTFLNIIDTLSSMASNLKYLK